jgi:DNA-binding transcriptional LysR family regulator
MNRIDIRSLDLAMLRTFDALLRERSVSRAAARLFLSQPAVSSSLKRLREAFDDQLFTRTAHGIVPTPKALALSPQLDAVLLQLQQMLNFERVFDPTDSDRILRIAGSDHTSRTLLPALCHKLANINSRIRLQWEIGDYGLLAERLHKGYVNLALIPTIMPISGVETCLLYQDAYVAVARRGHPGMVRGMNMKTFCTMSQVVLSQSRSMLDDAIDLALARQNLQRRVQAAVTTFDQMIGLLTHSDMVAVFPQRVAEWYADQVDSSPLPLELPNYSLYLCWDERSNGDDATIWLKDRILETVRAQVKMPMSTKRGSTS